MPSLVDALLTQVAAGDATEEDRFQAIGQLRAETWIGALSVIVDIEGPEQAQQSLEALTQADSYLILLAVGWMPKCPSSQGIVTSARKARELHRQLRYVLDRWLRRESRDPGSVVRAIEAAYRTTLTQLLKGGGAHVRRDIIAMHYAFRHTIVSSVLDLIASCHTKPHQGLKDRSPRRRTDASWRPTQAPIENSRAPTSDANRH